jgi:hypothetical protein
MAHTLIQMLTSYVCVTLGSPNLGMTQYLSYHV